MPCLAVESQMINIYGGTGGNGGRGGVQSGAGGAGEGPTLSYEIRAESFTLTNNLVGSAVQHPKTDFRFVNLGDLILYDEIDKQNVVERRPIYRKGTGALIRHVEVVVGTRRVYCARIYKCQDPMTVIAYNDSEFEQRRAEVQKAQQYRHPSLAQLFGFTCSAGLNALIYHDDIMTISQIRKMHAQSTLASLYIKTQMWQQFYTAYFYWNETTGKSASDLPGTAWIQMSTGKLCLDIGDGVKRCSDIWRSLAVPTLAELPSFKLMENELHAKLLYALKLNEFHAMAVFSEQYFCYTLPSSTETITLPSICITDDQGNFQSHQLLTIPFPNHLTPNDIYVGHWDSYLLDNDYVEPWHSYPLHKEVMPTGWTRVEYLDNPEYLLLWMSVQVNNVMEWWISQQNYVCKHLQHAIGGEEDFLPLPLIAGINFRCTLNTRLDGFTLQGTFMTNAPQHQVYLFLFPPQVELMDGQLTIMNPDDSEKYYWSCDPTGLKRLAREAAEDIGLPTPQFSVEVTGWRGNESTLDMIHEFYAAKGYDPDSQEAAIAMGYPQVDIKYTQEWARDLTGKHFADCPDDEDNDEIYYSIGLC
ncbi:Reverse transcriptase-RNase H-integrase [Mycena venus]|uniref:Reverse transcriptase-RNase H-integrase n=1 Tax=Mycena venus TaxID=2733690 RepID=A0A8H6XH41_9AGAR|nr:Reverse transcriptase-RNase H-integrase [Mycena venus]